MVQTKELEANERKAVEELQIRMKHVLPQEKIEDVTFLCKFLKARNFDVCKAEQMLRKHLIWRKSYQVDTILRDFKPKEFFHETVELSHIGLDKEGDPIEYSPCGKLDGRDVLKCEKINNYVKHWIWYSERYRDFFREIKVKTGRESSRIVFIINLDKLTLGNVTNKQSAEICLRVIRMFCDNYPETLKAVYIINAPRYFMLLFTIIKTVMSREMLQKFKFFGYEGWKEKLLAIIDADVLPAFLGGNRTDPDGNPMCNTFVKHGGPIPVSFHLSKEDRFFKDMTRVQKVTVPPGGSKEIDIDVRGLECLIQWEFLITNNDIGFGLFYRAPEKEEMEELLPMQRYDTIDGTEIGQYRSQSVGKYIIVFDNSHSRVTSKEIEYCITVAQSVNTKSLC